MEQRKTKQQQFVLQQMLSKKLLELEKKYGKLATATTTRDRTRCYRCSRSALTGNGALCKVCLEGDGVDLED